ncbi:glycoside hydrolase family 3 protein [Streptomyces sp. NPDC002644]
MLLGSAGGASAGQGGGDHTAWVEATLARMTPDEKIGQLFCTYVYGQTPDTVDSRNRAAFGVDTPARIVEEYALGGVIYFGWSANLASPPQIARLSNGLQRAALDRTGVPLLLSVDQEHGAVVRMGPPAATQLPGSMALGAGRGAGNAYQAAVVAGRELAAVGVNTDHAPIADVNVDARNPVIGVRAFSSDPRLTAGLTAAQVRGFQRGAGVISTVKHFPGHGDTATDSHTGLPFIDHTREEWEEIDLPPFRAAIDAGVDVVMTAHIVVESLDPSGEPATLSRPIMTGLLREELGFDGLVMSDSLSMAGVRQKYGDDRVPVLALLAGVDMMLMPPRIAVARDGIRAALASGELTEERLDRSVRRILELKARRGLTGATPVEVDEDPVALGRVVGAPAHLRTAQRLSDRAVTVLRDDAGLLPSAAETARSVLVTGVEENGLRPVATLADRLAARGGTAVARPLSSLPAMPTEAAVAEAAEAARRHDLTVVLTTKAWDTAVTDKAGRQRELVRRLVGTGTPVVVVAVRDPYDVAWFPEAPTCLTTYAHTPMLMESVARILLGEIAPEGRLPVDVPTADDPGVVLYPLGHGLTWAVG